MLASKAVGWSSRTSTLDYTDAREPFTLGFLMNHKAGFDVDALAGYDFGMVRLEAEVAYKHASLQDTKVDPGLSGTTSGTLFSTRAGTSASLTGMVNALLDFGDENGLHRLCRRRRRSGAGPLQCRTSICRALMLQRLPTARSLWQAIAGVRYAVSPSMDVGLKYRFLNVSNLEFQESVHGLRFDLQGRLRTHSLLAERDLQLRGSAAAASAASASASAASAASSGDADVPGWFGDPGDGYVSGSAASAAAAAAGARARLTKAERKETTGPGITPGPVFFCGAATAFAACKRDLAAQQSVRA